LPGVADSLIVRAFACMSMLALIVGMQCLQPAVNTRENKNVAVAKRENIAAARARSAGVDIAIRRGLRGRQSVTAGALRQSVAQHRLLNYWFRPRKLENTEIAPRIDNTVAPVPVS
jgi:hypothetical protein